VPLQAEQLLALALVVSVSGGLLREGRRLRAARRQLDAYLQWMLADIGRPARS
jgi:hypothetical protein